MEPVLHVSEADLISNLRSIIEQATAGAEIIIERNAQPIAVLRAAAPARRTVQQALALMPADSGGVIDNDFAKDVQAAIDAHREPLEPVAWD